MDVDASSDVRLAVAEQALGDLHVPEILVDPRAEAVPERVEPESLTFLDNSRRHGRTEAASLNDTGRATVVLDTGAASRGSGNKSSNKEKTIRQAFIEADLIEAVILLPENLFYNTTAPGVVVLLSHVRPNLPQLSVRLHGV